MIITGPSTSSASAITSASEPATTQSATTQPASASATSASAITSTSEPMVAKKQARARVEARLRGFREAAEHALPDYL
jgi:hypothetical protein